MYCFNGVIQSTSSVVLRGTLQLNTLNDRDYLSRGVAIVSFISGLPVQLSQLACE